MAAGARAAREKARRAMTRNCHWRRGWMAALCSLALLGAVFPASAAGAADDAVAAFYAGRRMIMVSGHTPEGGDRQQERAFAGMTITSGLKARGDDDLHGRLLARHMGRHIPGRPSFAVHTMPGAGGRRAAAYH
jgi:hypothetical protein